MNSSLNGFRGYVGIVDFGPGTDDTVIIAERAIVLRGAAFYQDRYERRDGEWRIAHTEYERLYEAMISLQDLPSFNLTAKR